MLRWVTGTGVDTVVHTIIVEIMGRCLMVTLILVTDNRQEVIILVHTSTGANKLC